jgi:hypothetical protein
MLGKILASGQLGKLASFASPAFFDVMPAKALWSRGRALLAESRNGEAFRLAVAARSAELASSMPSIRLVAKATQALRGENSDSFDRAEQGSRIVELYFHQLFVGHPTLIDLRKSAFSPCSPVSQGPNQLIWQPAPWIVEWAPEFIAPLRDVYRGFYSHDDALFRQALSLLSLSHSEDLFRKHFGGDQAEVRFEMKHFVDTFHAVFTRCKAAGTSLHPDFLPLGIYLAALYDHLAELAVAVDVAQAFRRAIRSPTAPEESIHA